MKFSLLDKMFKNEISIEEFKSILQNEIKQYKEKLKTKGTAIPIRVEEDINLYFKNSDLIKICNYYLDGDLSPMYIYYISDCITLSESVVFESKELIGLLEELTDPEINEEISRKRVVSILRALE